MDPDTQSRVDWPLGFDRRSPAERKRARKFDVSISQAFDDLEAELGRMDVDDFRYSFDADERKTDGRPYSRASPDDPSFVLRWTMGGTQYAVACDRWTALRDNVRSVGLYILEKRKMENRPVTTGESEFANAALPSGDEDVIVAGSGSGGRSRAPHEILEVAPSASDEAVKGAARRLKRKYHPDSGENPDRDEFMAVNRAEETLIDE